MTNICEEVLKSQDKIPFLKETLGKLNECLPAAVYLPILNDDYRNYMVLNILPEETKCFLTAHKAPYLVVMEVFQPQELRMYIQNPKDPKKQIKNSKGIMKNLNSELSKAQFV